MRLIREYLIPKTWIEWLVVVAIVAVLVALVVPETKWAADGSIDIPVRVHVFDAETMRPIQGARVAVVRGPVALEGASLGEHQDDFSRAWATILDGQHGDTTSADGIATIDYSFHTSASYKTSESIRNPTMRAHVRSHWIFVASEFHDRVAVPLRYQSIPTKSLREEGVLPAFVGLVRRESEEE